MIIYDASTAKTTNEKLIKAEKICCDKILHEKKYFLVQMYFSQKVEKENKNKLIFNPFSMLSARNMYAFESWIQGEKYALVFAAFSSPE